MPLAQMRCRCVGHFCLCHGSGGDVPLAAEGELEPGHCSRPARCGHYTASGTGTQSLTHCNGKKEHGKEHLVPVKEFITILA